MNDKIRQFANECFVIDFEKNIYANEYMIERFAELIIQECIEVCLSRAGNSDYNTGRTHCISDIKEHFGVK